MSTQVRFTALHAALHPPSLVESAVLVTVAIRCLQVLQSPRVIAGGVVLREGAL